MAKICNVASGIGPTTLLKITFIMIRLLSISCFVVLYIKHNSSLYIFDYRSKFTKTVTKTATK